MNKSYADVLESYMIAEEGFGSAIIGTAAFIGGIALIGKISDVRFKNKLKKEIRANSGKPSDYGGSIFNILSRYSKDITGVLEPEKSKEWIKLYLEKLSIANEADKIRNEFSNLNPEDNNVASKCKQINAKILKLQNKAKVINEKLSSEDMFKLSETLVPLQSTIIKRLNEISWDILYTLEKGGHDGYTLITTEDFYFNDKFDGLCDNFSEAKECVKNYDDLADILVDRSDPDDDVREYIKKCKFAIDPNSNLK